MGGGACSYAHAAAAHGWIIRVSDRQGAGTGLAGKGAVAYATHPLTRFMQAWAAFPPSGPWSQDSMS